MTTNLYVCHPSYSLEVIAKPAHYSLPKQPTINLASGNLAGSIAYYTEAISAGTWQNDEHRQ